MINNVTLSPPPITPPSLSVSLCTCSPCAGEGEGAAGQLRLIGRQPLHQSQGQHRVGVRRWLRVQLGVRARGAAQPKEAPRRGQLKNPPPVCEGPCALLIPSTPLPSIHNPPTPRDSPLCFLAQSIFHLSPASLCIPDLGPEEGAKACRAGGGRGFFNFSEERKWVLCSLLFFSLFFWFWSPTSPPFIGSGSSVGALQQRRLGNNKQDNPDSQIRQLRYLRTFFFLLQNLSPLSSKRSPEEQGRSVRLQALQFIF